MTVAVEPGSPEWLRVVSASKVAAILGVSPWMSPRALWHLMRGDVAHDAVDGSKPHLELGHDLEPAIALMWQRRNPRWRLSRGERQFVNDGLPFPNLATLDRVASRGVWRRNVQLKSAREDEHWGEVGTDQIPAPYLVQVIFEMLVSGLRRTDVMVLFSWFEPRLYRVDFDEPLAEAIVEACTLFHASLDGDEPPDLDDTAATLAVMKKLHPDIDADEIARVPQDMAIEFLRAGHYLELAEARDNLARSRVLEAAGTAKYIESGGVRIARRQRNGRGVSLYRLKAVPADIANPTWKEGVPSDEH